MESVEGNIHDLLRSASRVRQLLCVSAFFWINLAVGFSQGLTMVQVPPLSAGEDVVLMTGEEINWLASLGFISATVGHLIGGFIANTWGRRAGALFICPLFVSGFLLNGLGQIPYVLYIGKLLLGLASGLQAPSCSSYYSEVTSPDLRTTVHTLAMAANCLGVLIPIVFTRFDMSWRMFAIIANFAPILGFIHIYCVPESPAWLVMKGKTRGANQSLIKLRGPDYSHDIELDYLKQSHLYSKSGSSSSDNVFHRFRDPDVWKPFLIVNATFVLQVWTGFAALRGYIIIILQSSGSTLNPYDIALVSRCSTTLGQLLCSLLNTKCGRRSLFITSSLLTGLSLVGFGLSFWAHPHSSEIFSSPSNTSTNGEDTSHVVAYNPIFDYLPAIFISTFCFFYTLGLGPIPWAYSNELFPTDIRSILYSFTTCLVPLQNFAAVKMLPTIFSSLGMDVTLYFFGGTAFLSVLWGLFVLPETKGLTLHEINLMFNPKTKEESLAASSTKYSVVPTSSTTIIRSRTISE